MKLLEDVNNFSHPHCKERIVDNVGSVLANLLGGGLAGIMVFTGLPCEAVIVLTSLMVIDSLTGLGRAYVCGEQITSRKIKIGALSKLLMLLLPITTALAAKGVSLDLKWMVLYSMNALILSEAYSILSNLVTIRTGKRLPEFDAISLLGGKIREIMETSLKNTSSKD